jgi:hypothetical protein
MRRKWIFFVGPPAAVVVIGLCGWLIELLWNWLMPALFGLRTIGIWQALGLFLLSRILFGGWGGPDKHHRYHHGHGCRPGPRGPFTEEERERFRQEWGRRWEREECCPPKEPGPAPAPPENPA